MFGWTETVLSESLMWKIQLLWFPWKTVFLTTKLRLNQPEENYRIWKGVETENLMGIHSVMITLISPVRLGFGGIRVLRGKYQQCKYYEVIMHKNFQLPFSVLETSPFSYLRTTQLPIHFRISGSCRLPSSSHPHLDTPPRLVRLPHRGNKGLKRQIPRMQIL